MAEKTDYSGPVPISESVYWIGVRDSYRGLMCNPYLVTDGKRAVVIDSGSRTEFPQIMMQILRVGIRPELIEALVYQHYDLDLCSNLPHLEKLISRPDLKVISHSENNAFIRYLGAETELLCIDDLGGQYKVDPFLFRFIRVPYAHTLGTFITHEQSSDLLFTSDIFGAFDEGQNLLFDFDNGCPGCARQDRRLSSHVRPCPVLPMAQFNKVVMPNGKALKMALKKISAANPKIICPQHGSIFRGYEQTEFAVAVLSELKEVGIDGWR